MCKMKTVIQDLEKRHRVKALVEISSWNKGFSRFPCETYFIKFIEDGWNIDCTYTFNKADFSAPNASSTFSDIYEIKLNAKKHVSIIIPSFTLSYRNRFLQFILGKKMNYRVKTDCSIIRDKFKNILEIKDFFNFLSTRNSIFNPVIEGKMKENTYEIKTSFFTVESPNIEFNETYDIFKVLFFQLSNFEKLAV